MTIQEAVSILMLSPFYFKMSPAERRKLVQEYCDFFNKLAIPQNEPDTSKK